MNNSDIEDAILSLKVIAQLSETNIMTLNNDIKALQIENKSARIKHEYLAEKVNRLIDLVDIIRKDLWKRKITNIP